MFTSPLYLLIWIPLVNEGIKVLVDWSARKNSNSVHFTSNGFIVQLRNIVEYNENSFYAQQIIPYLTVLSTVCNLIVFHRICEREKGIGRGRATEKNTEKTEREKSTNNLPPSSQSNTYEHTWNPCLLEAIFFSFKNSWKAKRSDIKPTTYYIHSF